MVAKFDFLKDIFGKEEPTIDIVSLSDIPGIVAGSESSLNNDIFERTADQRARIISDRQELIDLVNALSSAEREEAFHPKLEKIAKNTLPLFKKAMLAALSREISLEPEDFYQAGMECLKGCLKSQAGQGRYLQGVFPEEMKAIRVAIDKIGREMNSMTPVISEARKSRELIRASRETYHILIERISEKESAEQEKLLIEKDLKDQTALDRRLSDELSAGRKDEALGIMHAKRVDEESKRKDLENIERQMRATFSSISHVFRKGEKIMQRGESGRASKEIHKAIALLSESGIPYEHDLISSLAPVLPAMESMIKSGEIILKNKEEKAIFSQPSEIPSLLGDLYSRQKLAKEQVDTAAKHYREDPQRKKILAIEKEIAETEKKISDDEIRFQAIESTIRECGDEIPRLSEQLRSRIRDLTGREIRLEMPA